MKRKELILKSVAEMAAAFQKRDKDSFLRFFSLSVVEHFYLAKFFDNYTCKSILACDYSIKEVCDERFDLKFDLKYIDGDAESIKLMLSYVLIDDIVCVKKVKTRCLTGHINVNRTMQQDKDMKDILVSISHVKHNHALDAYHNIMSIQSKTVEPNCQKKYMRALSGSIRYRMANPIIDCAIILSNMLSPKLIMTYDKTKQSRNLDNLKIANRLFDMMFIHKSYDNVTDDARKFPFRELSLEQAYNNFDELLHLYIQSNMQPIPIMCSEISPLYTAWMSLMGITEEKQFMISLPFHYMSYVSIENKDYLIDVNNITCINGKEVYGSYDYMTGISTAQYYVDQAGHTNMEHNYYQKMMNNIKKSLRCFSFERGETSWDTINTRVDLPTICKESEGVERQKRLLEYTYVMSNFYPESSYTWAKYVHQSIIVGFPQCYVLYGLQDSRFIEWCRHIQTMQQLKDYISGLEEGSIFSLPYQLMTVLQVLHHGVGNENEKMLLFYSVSRVKKWITKGYLVITSEGAFVVYKKENDNLFVINTKNETTMMDGEIYIAFNEEEHYSKWDGKTEKLTWEKIQHLVKN